LHSISCPSQGKAIEIRQRRRLPAIQKVKAIFAALVQSRLPSQRFGMVETHAVVRRAVRLHHISHPKLTQFFFQIADSAAASAIKSHIVCLFGLFVFCF
jgi:hypothetical protein